jgi:hypothetical protein
VDVGGGLHVAEDKLLGTEPDSVAVDKFDRIPNEHAVDAATVPAAQILKDHASASDADAGVTTRNRRIEDRDVALFAASHDRIAQAELELLKRKSQTIAGWLSKTSRGHGYYCHPTPLGFARLKNTGT